ncbi:MAG TPA: hypothetical protein VGM93_08365, partial [Acidimicrobiales bacterium]
SAVTLFIWGNRIWLAWTQKGVGLPAKLALSIPITLFVVASAALLGLLLQGVDRTSPRFRGIVRILAAGTVAFWVVRAPMILAHPHPVAFKAVHAVLALVSIAAAVVAWPSVDDVDAAGRRLAPRRAEGPHTDALV